MQLNINPNGAANETKYMIFLLILSEGINSRVDFD